jgi:hypothetical protein
MIQMLYEQIQDVPRLAPRDWKTLFKENLIPDEHNDWDGQTFRGLGVPIQEHPLKSNCNMQGCGNCKSENVKVIYAQWSVSVASGDAYWDYEIICEDCGKYTSRSFSEN